MNATIKLACHEFDANYLFDQRGLQPFFACDSRIKAGNGKQVATFETDGERWVAKLYYQDSGVVPPESGMTTTGTEWSLDEPREFRLFVGRHPKEDDVGKQDFNCHIQPRWQGMRVENKHGEISEYSVPDDIEEGINVRVQGSNIDFFRYQTLLQKAAAAVGISVKYFRNPHQYSNIQDAERYVRLHKDASGPIHARDGPIAEMGHLLESDRAGYRKIVQNDDDERGRNRPGYYHTVTLGTRRIREAFPNHVLPKELKHYYAREAVSLPFDHPLAHPKVGASYQVSLDDRDEKIGVTDEDIETLIHELDQTVLSALAEAGIDIHPSDTGAFFEGAYFDAETTTDGPEPVALDLTHIKSTQESVVVRHLADGLSPVQWESLETLVTDGGEIAPGDIAEEHGRHVESVRRALRNMEDLVHKEYAKVSLRSDYVAEMVHEAVKEAKSGVQRAMETSAKAIRAAKRGLDDEMNTFIAWAAKHDIDVDDALSRRDVRMILRCNEMSLRETQRAIREGFRIWRAAGLPAERFRSARVEFADGGRSDAWRYLIR